MSDKPALPSSSVSATKEQMLMTLRAPSVYVNRFIATVGPQTARIAFMEAVTDDIKEAQLRFVVTAGRADVQALHTLLGDLLEGRVRK